MRISDWSSDVCSSDLVRYGFTSVVDTGSDPRDTGPLRARIESGEIAGPRIITAMSPLFPPAGVPYYVRDALPPEVLPLLSQPATADEAAALVRTNLAGAGDVVKLFTGPWVKEGGSRSAERRVGKEGGGPGRRRGSPDP